MPSQLLLPFDDFPGPLPSNQLAINEADGIPDELLYGVQVTVPADVWDRVHLRERSDALNKFIAPEVDDIRGPGGRCRRVRIASGGNLSSNTQWATAADLEQLTAKYTELAKQQLAKRQMLIDSGSNARKASAAINWAARFMLLARHYAGRSAELLGSSTIVLPFEEDAQVTS
jgi:putative lipoic acid-binding regulatory protein